MWESWRTYISFALVGTIFILCQALSGGTPGNQVESASGEPAHSTYRVIAD
jgi:hypothetical protein